MRLKQIALSALTHPAVGPLLRPLRRGVGTIFMLHRFAHPDRGVRGHPAGVLRESLAYLRRGGYRVVPLTELLDALRTPGALREPAVAFTVDDGYADFSEVGAPIFAEFDCPVTLFVTTGPLDGVCWFWWDRLEFAMEHAARPALAVEVAGAPLRLTWATDAEREAAWYALVEALKRVPDAERQDVLASAEAALGASVPAAPPPRYTTMSWDEARQWAGAGTGVTFGPHTVTHPILSRVTDAQAAFEIGESWRRLRDELRGRDGACVPVFCYPNGKDADFLARDVEAVRAAGLDAAVTTEHGHAAPASAARPARRYAVPRFPYPDDMPHFVQIATGLERAKMALRGALA
ncbi:MAG: polysaccharide deacetylase family protein [Gemmatimonadaceae bacterium]